MHEKLHERALAENTARERADAVNLAAVFFPVSCDDTVPEVKVGGVAISTYVDKIGVLRVSVHTDTGEVDPMLLRDGERVAMRLKINDTIVFDAR